MARAVTLTWANPLLRDLETQALVPMFGERPVELGLVGVEDEVLARLAAEPRYPPLFAEAFPAAAEPIILRSVVRALAAFERTLIATASPYDAYLAGNERALTRSAQRGAQLFLSDRLGCAGCHSGPDLTDGAFHNTGLYDEDGGGAYPPDNLGLFEFTGEPADVGRFRTPTLRNVGVTAPYMHDGSEGTLDAVLDQYAAGGRTDSRYKSERLSAFVISAQERADVLSFLHSLTDEHFLSAEALSDPWR